MCTDEDYKETFKLNEWSPFMDRIHMSQGYLPPLEFRLLSLLL